MSAQKKYCALTVDLDEIHHYYRIFGLPEPSKTEFPIHQKAVPEIAIFAEQHRIPVSFFAVGSDLHYENNAEQIRRLAMHGHEVESHSFAHDYRMSTWSTEMIAHDVKRSMDVIRDVTGRTPLAFRAPGYTRSENLLDALERCGIKIDSSIFSNLPYYVMKASVLSALAVKGRTTVSLLESSRSLFSPRQPYRMDRSGFSHGNRSIVELPIYSHRWFQVPMLGAAIALLPSPLLTLVTQLMNEPWIVIELHGIDFLEIGGTAEPIAKRQPELRKSLFERRQSFAQCVCNLKKHGYTFVTLSEMAYVLTN